MLNAKLTSSVSISHSPAIPHFLSVRLAWHDFLLCHIAWLSSLNTWIGTFRQYQWEHHQKDPTVEAAPEGTTLFTLISAAPEGTTLFTLLQSLLPHLNCFSTNKQQKTVWSWSAKNGTYMRSQHWAKYHIKGIKLHD